MKKIREALSEKGERTKDLPQSSLREKEDPRDRDVYESLGTDRPYTKEEIERFLKMIKED